MDDRCNCYGNSLRVYVSPSQVTFYLFHSVWCVVSTFHARYLFWLLSFLHGLGVIHTNLGPHSYFAIHIFLESNESISSEGVSHDPLMNFFLLEVGSLTNEVGGQPLPRPSDNSSTGS